MLADQPPRPANMRTIVAINEGRIPQSEEDAPLPELTPEEVVDLVGGGAIVLDVRAHADYDRAHVDGSIHVSAASNSFEQYVGWIVPEDGPLVVLADGRDSAGDARHKLAYVGLDRRVIGFVGFESWRGSEHPIVSAPPLDVGQVRADLARGHVHVLDVRERDEFVSGHVPGARHMNFKYLPNELGTLDLREDDPVAVLCAGGLRSAIACSVLRRAGYRKVRNVEGGMGAWRRAGLPVDGASA
jgi:hydroxyacylglutathione hydrolase